MDNCRHKNGQDTVKTAILADSDIAPRGFEPLNGNQQTIEDKELIKRQNSVLDTSLDKILQKYPELQQIITAWSSLSENTKKIIKFLIERS